MLESCWSLRIDVSDTNVTDLIDQIDNAFADVERPDDKDYTRSNGGEAYEETAAFFGRNRGALAADFLETHRGVMHWFTPEAFHYYLPAFLSAAVETDDPYALYVHTILFLLRPNSHQDFRRARWSKLDDKQIDALRAWLRWLLDRAVNDDILTGEVREALDVIDSRLWW